MPAPPHAEALVDRVPRTAPGNKEIGFSVPARYNASAPFCSTNMTPTETEVKEAMKKALDEPSGPTEHRLLARLDEPAPPKLLADDVEGKERSQSARM